MFCIVLFSLFFHIQQKHTAIFPHKPNKQKRNPKLTHYLFCLNKNPRCRHWHISNVEAFPSPCQLFQWPEPEITTRGRSPRRIRWLFGRLSGLLKIQCRLLEFFKTIWKKRECFCNGVVVVVVKVLSWIKIEIYCLRKWDEEIYYTLKSWWENGKWLAHLQYRHTGSEMFLHSTFFYFLYTPP